MEKEQKKGRRNGKRRKKEKEEERKKTRGKESRKKRAEKNHQFVVTIKIMSFEIPRIQLIQKEFMVRCSMRPGYVVPNCYIKKSNYSK